MIYNVNQGEPGNSTTELLVIRLAITNSNVDPWVYILLRKEHLERIKQVFSRVYHAVNRSSSFTSTDMQTRNERSKTSEMCNSSRQ